MSVKAIVVARPGLFTTVQDLGRHGYRNYGVPVCGALDELSCRLANFLLQNDAHSPVLEITQQGPELQMLVSTALSLTGADLSPKLNGLPIEMNEAFFVAKGDVLSFGKQTIGWRSYLAIRGGFQSEKPLGSASTHVRSGWGGLNGSPIKANQVLHTVSTSRKGVNRITNHNQSIFGNRIRIIQGPEHYLIKSNALDSNQWTVDSQSDRAGLRLQGPHLRHEAFEMVSSPTDIGTVQLPKSGQPLILLNDGPSVGGYPRVASVITADLPKLAQLELNAPLTFEWVSLQQADLSYRAYRDQLSKLGAY